MIEHAKQNDVHLLCLPAHTKHVLQPIDVRVFSSFKHNVGLALNALVRSYDGRVPTSENIPGVTADAWPKSFTPVNLMSGFRKTGIHPLNPGCIHDRLTGPSKATDQPDSPELLELGPLSLSSSINVSSDLVETAESVNSLKSNVEGGSSSSAVSREPKSSISSLSDAMDALLMQPKLTRKVKKKQASYNSKAVCITDNAFMEKKERKGTSKEQNKARGKRSCGGQRKVNTLTEESDCEGPMCGEHYGDRSTTWIQCNTCEEWYDTQCAGIDSEELPDEYLCDFCRVWFPVSL